MSFAHRSLRLTERTIRTANFANKRTTLPKQFVKAFSQSTSKMGVHNLSTYVFIFFFCIDGMDGWKDGFEEVELRRW
jgi:hypothetical protein